MATRANLKNKDAPVSEKEFSRNLGFTERDSAGQSNIFAVEPQVYLQKGENSALVFGVTFVGVVAALGLGYTLIAEKEAQVDADLAFLEESGLTMSSFEKKFAPPPPPAPVKVVVQEAPAPAIEEAPVAVEAAE